MNKKIPCGGFELDDSLTLDSEKKLGVNWDEQVQSDWNENDVSNAAYVKNRTHWTEYEYAPGVPNNGSFTPTKIVLERRQNYYYCNISSLILTGNGVGDSVVSTGSKVRIIFDDKEYILIVDQFRIDNDLYLGVGNFAIFAGEATEDKPFFIIIHGEFVEVYTPLDNGNTHMIQIDVVKSENVHQLDSKYIPSTTYLVRLNDDAEYTVDKSFDDIKMAIDDGKYVVLYYPEENEVYQLSDYSSFYIRFTRATPYGISRIHIDDANKVDYMYINLVGTKNWLCSYNDAGFMTPVKSLEYIKLKSPNGTLYTISVTNDGTIQAQAEAQGAPM